MKKKPTILYVDDEEDLRFLVKDQLGTRGFEVQTADDGDTATEMMKKGSYDLILLDIRMPRMNGIEVLKYMRENKVNARTIMLTGMDDLTIALEAVKNGANDYLTKPYEVDGLVKSITRVLG